MSGTWVLDSEALSRYLRDDRETVTMLKVAVKRDIRVIVSALTVVEADPRGTHRARLAWALSRLAVVPVTKEDAIHAVSLLREGGSLTGHTYAIDALVAATALRARPPVTVLTSDPEDLRMLCGDGIAVVKL